MILVIGHEKLNIEMQRTYGSQLTVVKIPKSGGVRSSPPLPPLPFFPLFSSLSSKQPNLPSPLLSSSSTNQPNQVVELDPSYRDRILNMQLHTYFYGESFTPPPGLKLRSNAVYGGEALSDLVLSPASTTVGFEELAVWQIGES